MRFLLLLSFALALGACASTRQAEPDPAEVEHPPPGGGEPGAEDPGAPADLTGNWYAAEMLDDPKGTADIESGVLDIVLIIRPDRRVIYTGVDRAASDRDFSSGGRIEENIIRLYGLSGTAEMSFSGGNMHLTDPNGRVTVFVKGP